MQLKSSQKTTEYTLSKTQLIDMLAEKLSVSPSQITLIPRYVTPDYDGPGYNQSIWDYFDITVKE